MGMEHFNYLTVYFVTREYGGPEEGGWYYDRYVKKFSFYTGGMSESDEDVLFSSLEAWSDSVNDGKPRLHSVSSRGEYWIIREEESGALETTERPRYE